ncbi:uncharacterized protein [Procambarus clarkii]|uniref:uncharacterized protein n=1 Tax=Procambarus clarkii TaxID=6728 RepID=UPI0037444F19
MTPICLTVLLTVVVCVGALPTSPPTAPQTPAPPSEPQTPAPPSEPQAPAPPSRCQYWCRTPEDTFYCCTDDHLSDPTEHAGYCPATRVVCPVVAKLLPDTLPRRDYNGVAFPDLPKFCATDGGCEDYEKCCFDRCFRKHVCKFASSEDVQLLRYSEEAALQGDVVQLGYAYDPHRFL